MSTTDNSQKNLKAAAITVVVHVALLLLFFFITIAMAVPAPPKVEEGIEVNLGNSDIGFGDVQPLIPDEPAPDIQQESTPPKQQIAEVFDDKEKEISEKDDADAPELNKPIKKTTPAKVVPVNNPPVIKTNQSTKTVSNPIPKPQTAKTTMKSGTSTGISGNNSDEYNNSRNQGIAGGNDDQGKQNGNANSDNYNVNGSSGKVGIPKVKNGKREILNVKHYTFNDNLGKATIFANIKVSPNGVGTFISFALGSTDTKKEYKNAIIEYLLKIEFNKADHESTVTVQFNFNVN